MQAVNQPQTAYSIPVQGFSSNQKRMLIQHSQPADVFFGSKAKNAEDPKLMTLGEIAEELNKKGNFSTFEGGLKALKKSSVPTNIHMFTLGLLSETLEEVFHRQNIPVMGTNLDVIKQNYKDLLDSTNFQQQDLLRAVVSIRKEFGIKVDQNSNSNPDYFDQAIDFIVTPLANHLKSMAIGDKTPHIETLRNRTLENVKKAETQENDKTEHTKTEAAASQKSDKSTFWGRLTNNIGNFDFNWDGENSILKNPLLHGALMVGGVFAFFIPTAIGAYLFYTHIYQGDSSDTTTESKKSAPSSSILESNKKDEKEFRRIMTKYFEKYPQPEDRTRGNLMKMVLDEALDNKYLSGNEKCPQSIELAANSIAYFQKVLNEVKTHKGISEPDDFRDALKTFSPSLTSKQQDAINTLIDNYERLATGLPNKELAKEHLNMIFSMPWGKKDDIDLTIGPKDIKRVFDATHVGMPAVKKFFAKLITFEQDRAEAKINAEKSKTEPLTQSEQAIVDKMVAEVEKAKAEKGGKFKPILFVGPPGVGKTSIGQNIATAMNRKLIVKSLSGIDDPKSVKGTNRTYIGAEAGLIVDAIQEAGTMNPVVMLDELDKISAGYHGNPLNPLLAIMDPQQNQNYVDENFQVPLDLSETLFIATANSLDPIPEAVRDRFQIIQFPGYTINEQVEIGHRIVQSKLNDITQPASLANLTSKKKKYNNEPMVSGNPKNHPLLKQLNKELLHKVAIDYPGGAGVRTMEKIINSLIEGWVHAVHEKRSEAGQPLTLKDLPKITADNLEDYLEEIETVPLKVYTQEELDKAEIGKIRGMYFSKGARSGGSIEFAIQTPEKVTKSNDSSAKIEVIPRFNHGDTTQLSTEEISDFLMENIDKFEKAAPTFVEAFKSGCDIPIKIKMPQYETGVEGPSATAAFTLAIISKLTGYELPVNLAITGSMAYDGKEGIIGGVMDKIMGSYNQGITNFYVPPHNYKQYLKKIKDHPDLKDKITVKPFNHIHDIMTDIWGGENGPEDAKDFIDQFEPEKMSKTMPAKLNIVDNKTTEKKAS